MMLIRRQFVKGSTVGLAAVDQWSRTLVGAFAQSTSGLRVSTGEFGFNRRVDSIDWYYELRGRGPTIVLISSGEGDCGSFEEVAASLSEAFTVLTFDMPGFS